VLRHHFHGFRFQVQLPLLFAGISMTIEKIAKMIFNTCYFIDPPSGREMMMLCYINVRTKQAGG